MPKVAQMKKLSILCQAIRHKTKTDKEMNTVKIEFCNAAGAVLIEEKYSTELQAQNAFDKLHEVRYPMTYKGLTLNLGEYYTGGNIGFVRLRVDNQHGSYIRRELFRNA